MQAVLNIYKKLGLDCGKYTVAACAKYVSHVKVAKEASSGKVETRTKINRHKKTMENYQHEKEGVSYETRLC